MDFSSIGWVKPTQIKDNNTGNCCLSAQALGRKSKDWLVQNQDNVLVRSNTSICSLLLRHVSLEQSDFVILSECI